MSFLCVVNVRLKQDGLAACVVDSVDSLRCQSNLILPHSAA